VANRNLATWDDKESAKLNEYVQLSLDMWVNDPNGGSHLDNFADLFNETIYIKILSHKIKFQDIAEIEIKQQLVKAALRKLKSSGKHGIKNFQNILNQEVETYLNWPVDKYYVLCPLNLSQESLSRNGSFTVKGVKLLVRDWWYVDKHFSMNDFITDIEKRFELWGNERPSKENIRRTFMYYFTPIIILADGRTFTEAFKKANEAFHLFRSLLNLSVDTRGSIYRFRTRVPLPQPSGTIWPPSVYAIFNEKGDYRQFFYNLEKYPDYTSNKIDLKKIIETRKLIGRLSHATGDQDTLSLMAEAFAKYGDALDATEWRLAFLTFWQIFELITLQSTDESSMGTAIKRVNSLLAKDQIAQDLLQAVNKTRNDLVHRGQFPENSGEEQVKLIKRLVESVLGAMLFHIKVLKTKGILRSFYEQVDLVEGSLLNQERAIKYILRQKQTKRKPSKAKRPRS